MKEETAAKKTNPRESFVRKRGNTLKQETQNELERFRDYLREQEKSSHTIEKYCRDVRKFLMFADEDWDKKIQLYLFKEYLQAHYKNVQRQFDACVSEQLLSFYRKTGILCPHVPVQKRDFL